MKRIELFTAIGKGVPAQIIFQDTRKLIKWGQAYIDELMSPERWGEIWLTDGQGNRALMVNQGEFPQFIIGFKDRTKFRDTEDSEFFLGKIKSLMTAEDYELIDKAWAAVIASKEVVAHG